MGQALQGRFSVTATLWRLRFTVLFVSVLIVANGLAGSLWRPLPVAMLEAWGIGYDSLFSGEISRLVTGTFLSHDPDMALRQIAFAASVIGYTEWRRGTALTAALFFGLDIFGTVLLLVLLGVGGAGEDLMAMNDVGMSFGGFGLIGLAIAGWPRKGWLLGGLLAAIAAKTAISPEIFADAGHGLALVLGFALAWVLPPQGAVGGDHAQ